MNETVEKIKAQEGFQEDFLSTPADIARIIIHDMTGKQLKSIELEYFGESSVSIYSGELIAGMYMYSLLVDGNIADTKQMILTE